MNTTVALILGIVLILVNAFFVGSEFAVMAARRSQLEPLAEQGNRRAQLCLTAMEQVTYLLACAQLGITVCSVLLGAVAEPALHHLLQPLAHLVGIPDAWSHVIALAVALLIVAYLHIVVGEMIPKNLSIARPETAALWLAPPLLLLSQAVKPAIIVLTVVSNWLVKVFGVDPKDEITSTFTAEEVGHILEESAREGLVKEPQRGLTTRVLEFTDQVAADVAVPQEQWVTVPHNVTPDQLERLVAKTGYSRFPVVDADAELMGYMHVKDVIYADDSERFEPVPPKRIRRLAAAHATDEVEEVLTVMQESGAHLARVVDRTGSLVGIVFLEDVLEQLIGEVRDVMVRA